MEYRTKSLNCHSCGAGLIKKVESNTCKCRYCGNSNLILDDGSTAIFPEDPIKKAESKKDKVPFWFILVLSIGVVVIPLFFLNFTRKREKEKRVYQKGGKVECV